VQNRLWNLTEYPFQPERQLYYETIFCIGNGYLGNRASFEEGYSGETPATLVHGLYNHAEGAQVPELANIPHWVGIRLWVDGTPFQMDFSKKDLLKPPGGVALGYQRTLDMRRGLLKREALFRAESGGTVRVTFERFASMDNVHLMVQRVTITAIDGEPLVDLVADLNADVHTSGNRHWQDIHTSADSQQMTVTAATTQSGYRLAMASALVGAFTVEPERDALRTAHKTRVQLGKDETITLLKLTAVATSRDADDPLALAQSVLSAARGQTYEQLFEAHCAQWDRLWATMDVQIEGDEEAQIALRFCAYHILIAAPRHTDDVSIGAKTLSGLGYKGHVFWDTELFVLPPLTLAHPSIARNLLMYRYRRLEGARRKARENGFEGAMFPWESTDTGEETTPKWSDPLPDGTRLRIWTGDNEQHISTDIAYAVLQYWRWTGDDAFLIDYGAEIVLDTAVFWGSRVEERGGRYELTNQIGPDEYHENIANSVFVNRMVQWHLQQALDLLKWLGQHAPHQRDALTQRLGLTTARLDKWRDIIARMYIPFDDEKQIHVQFDGFFDLEYIPVLKYEPRVGGIWPMLGHERALRSQVIKQADVVMMMALLGDAVGSREVMLNNFHTYYPRTDHGSSLSPAIHAWVAARLGLDDIAYHMFEHAAWIDLKDNKGNVRDGIHAAACGGLWQAVVFGFCGLHITPAGNLAVDPRLPAHWKRVSFTVNYRGERRGFTVEQPALVTPQGLSGGGQR
jgi:trehalose/maltose hydrolase-like predicted phosphorylase